MPQSFNNTMTCDTIHALSLKAISFLLVKMWGSFTDSDILMIILDKPTDKGSYRDHSVV